MTAATAAQHTIADLEYTSADDVLNLVYFRSLSAKARPGEFNLTALDVVTGETLCNCKGAECGRVCWHVGLIAEAWEAHPARVLASRYTTDQLLKAGTKMARMCRVYRSRIWRVLDDHAVALVACRQEWRRRLARAEDEARAESEAVGEEVAA